MDREPLFWKYDFSAAIRNAPSGLAMAIGALEDARLFQADQETLLNELVAAHVINVPILDLDAVSPAQREVDIDLSRDPQERFLRDLNGPYLVKATEISFHVPYKGDEQVFYCRPSSYSMNPPHGEIERDAIVIRIVHRDTGADVYRKAFDSTMTQIQQNLSQLRSDCASLQSTLRATAAAELAKRREKREKDKGLIDALGFGKAKS